MIHVLINQLARRGKGAKAANLIFRYLDELSVDYALVPGETLLEVKNNLQERVDQGAERILVAGVMELFTMPSNQLQQPIPYWELFQ